MTQQRLLGLEARIVMPLYDLARRGLTARGFSLEPLCDDCDVSLGFGRPERVRIVRARIDPRLLRSREDVRWASLSCVTEFVECDTAFGREGIYGDSGVDFEDNARRFAILARTAIERLRQLLLYNPAKDFVLHAHDWHAALAPLFLHADAVNDATLRDVARVVTVHNASFQGHLLPDALQQLGVPSELYDWRLAEWYGRANLLKGAMAVADRVTTVSPTHAQELRTPLGGFGLHEAFIALNERLVGIRNGIDTEIWDPQFPGDISSAYHLDDLQGKAASKSALQRRLHFPERVHLPLVAVCSRFCAQKGFDVIQQSHVGESPDIQLVFLGEGDRDVTDELRVLAGRYPKRIAVLTPFTDEAERMLLAGADILLMPSRFEPCGLAQLRAQRYGVVPVAHAVGGLADTIRDGETGFLFSPFRGDALRSSLERATTAFQNREAWRTIVHNCLLADVSWREPAAAYRRLYADALLARASTNGVSA